MFTQPVLAFAQAAAPAAGQQPGFLQMVVPFLFMFVIIYFLMIRPQAKKQKSHQAFLGSLKRGDSVLTSSGILGTIEGITEKWVTLSISDHVNIRVMKNFIVGPAQLDEAKK